jgi:integrase
MKNQRGQRGSIRIESGSWVGYWNTYQYNPSTDQNVRKQRSVKLGPKSLSRFKAFQILAGHIEQSVLSTSRGDAGHRPDSTLTLEKFTRTRWVPLKEATWRGYKNAKGREVNAGKQNAEQILHHIFKVFGNTPLEQLDKIALQIWLNDLAKTYSDSLVKHCRTYLKSILEEAVDQDYLRKNPAKKLTLPDTREVDKTTLTAEQFKAVLGELDEKHSLLLRVGAACAFRPSELLALRWRDFDPEARIFTIRWTIYRGVLRPFTKTTRAGSKEKHLLTVAIPDALAKELAEYRGAVTNGQGLKPWTADDHFIFSTKEGTIMHKENTLHRVLKPVRDKLMLPVLNFQVLRRTMATLSQHSGSVKDIQTHLRHRTADVTAQEYMQPITDSARGMVNTVYDNLLNKATTPPSH